MSPDGDALPLIVEPENGDVFGRKIGEHDSYREGVAFRFQMAFASAREKAASRGLRVLVQGHQKVLGVVCSSGLAANRPQGSLPVEAHK
jgi:hypothetical protein